MTPPLTKAKQPMIDQTEFEQVQKIVAELDKIVIRGNGAPSLQERMRNVEGYISENKESFKYYSRLIASILLAQLFTLIGSAIYLFLRVWPILDAIEKGGTWTP